MKSTILGASFAPADPSLLKKAGAAFGLRIESLEDGVLEEAGLSEGLTLLQLDKKGFRSLEDLHRIFRQGKGGMLLETINPDGERQYFVLLRPAP